MWRLLLSVLLLLIFFKSATTEVCTYDPTPVDSCPTPEEVAERIHTLIETETQECLNSIETPTEEPTSTTEASPKIGTLLNPASSCREIPQERPSGFYWIQTNTGTPTSQYCDTKRTSCCTTGGWMRVANLDMTDPNQHCPPGFRNITSPRRSCGRPTYNCISANYPAYGVEYSRVCGRIKAYQFGAPHAFRERLPVDSTIDGPYVDGASITHGSPRQHIWSFAVAQDETPATDNSNCRCTRPDDPFTGTTPSFVGNDYFCETGSRERFVVGQFYSEDPLWDGQGCGAISTCCSFNNPPWFCQELPQPTTDDIEVRVCANGFPADEDAPIEMVEIYVQ